MRVNPDEIKDIRMPRHSWDYEDVSDADHWFLLAEAYIDCCHYLLSSMIEENITGTFHHCKVVVSLFEHSVELFLKGAIVQAEKQVQTHHRIDEIFKQFINLYPGKKFEFTGSISEFVKPMPQAPVNEYARYPADQNGQSWLGHTHIDIAIYYVEASKFKDDYSRLKPLIKERYNKDKTS